MSESWLKSAPESMKVHSFDYGAWFRHVITRVRQADSVGFFNVVHGELELTVFKWVGYAIFGFAHFAPNFEYTRSYSSETGSTVYNFSEFIFVLY